jgi:NDP-sugar pyrophosphorylase family protein
MTAMVLAAGLGTRLRPLTNDRPKALVAVAGRTLLEIVLERLRAFGVTETIVNTHHHAEMIADYLAARGNFGMRIAISRERELLDTGGGLKQAAWFFLEDRSDEPFLLHNVDVISDIDLGMLLRFHRQQDALATLAVQDRPTSRYLLFDQESRLCGRRAGPGGKPEMARSAAGLQALAFTGIHAISPRSFTKLRAQGSFPIVSAYLRLAGEGENIVAFRADRYRWRDLGRPEHLAQAEREFGSGSSDDSLQ